MKLIQNSHLVYQRILNLFTLWINDVRSTEEIGINSDKGISMGTQGIYFWKDHPLGDFEIIFDQDSINENAYYNASCGVVISLLSARDNAVAFRSKTDQADAQLIKLSISAGYLLPRKDPSHCQRAFVTNELCGISYLFNGEQNARSIKMNNIEVSEFSEINRFLVGPAILSLFDFITSVIEENQEYSRFVAQDLGYFSMWMKK